MSKGKRATKKKPVAVLAPPKDYALDIRIYVDSDGGVRCASYTRPGRALTMFDTSLVVGALELAKASIVAGRWGVLDRETGEGRIIGRRPASHVGPPRDE